MSTETPFQRVSNFDHEVTQWMSTVGVSDGSARNCSQVQRASSPTVKVHVPRSAWGVGPAESTGKSWVRYWPGGSRLPSAGSGRRRPKPRLMIAMAGCSQVAGAGSGRDFVGRPATSSTTSSARIETSRSATAPAASCACGSELAISST